MEWFILIIEANKYSNSTVNIVVYSNRKTYIRTINVNSWNLNCTQTASMPSTPPTCVNYNIM